MELLKKSPSALSASIMLSVILGSLVHDAQLHNVASVIDVVSKKDVLGSHYATELSKRSSHIPLGEALTLSNSGGQQISTQPRNENDKKYLSPRRTATNHLDSDYNLLVIS
jgi:hypothetical protein